MAFTNCGFYIPTNLASELIPQCIGETVMMRGVSGHRKLSDDEGCVWSSKTHLKRETKVSGGFVSKENKVNTRNR